MTSKDTEKHVSHTKRQIFDKHLADVIAVAFVAVVVLSSASGPISEFVRWIIETTTAGFDELGRRDQRVLLREHWLGGSYRTFERSFLLPTGLIMPLHPGAVRYYKEVGVM